MLRVYLALALSVLVLLVLAALFPVLGAGPDRHVLLGALTLLLSCLVQTVVLTYLTVTGKLVAQAVHLGKLDDTPLRLVRHHKKTLARLMGAAIVMVILLAATGAIRWRSEGAAVPHLIAAVAGFLVHCYVFARQSKIVAANSANVGHTLDAYRRHVAVEGFEEKGTGGGECGENQKEVLDREEQRRGGC